MLLVGPPGVGKDQAVVPARELWAAAQQVNLAPICMTGKGLLDELADAQQQYVESGAWVNIHSLIIAVPEFGVLIPGYDLQFLSILNNLYDCPSIFEERLRKQDERLRIERPHICILAGTQPNYLGAVLPETAFGMGFMSRMIMIYAPVPTRAPLFVETAFNIDLQDNLVHDLRQIGELRGQFTIDSQTIPIIEHWHAKESLRDAPTHSRLRHYNARRIVHLLKLAMAFSAAESNDLVVRQTHWAGALSLLLCAEAAMPEIFMEMSAGTCNSVIEETANFCIGLRGLVREDKIQAFLAQRVPAYQIEATFNAMIKSGILVPDGLNLPGHRTFKITAPKRVEY